ncbi:hypothetical protein EVAR_82452_1 [Eumeta japonica]|uniref:Uncharacterized protein n=1 Tax=Eumeta variegata TaxID=151549 RepID=A0A4C1X895_EUMVA|nr:hypothetical protein EVAR_82452_1 [Eumeta japonica]
MMHRFPGDNSNAVCDIDTDDEGWIYYYDIETKRQSAQWVFPFEEKTLRFEISHVLRITHRVADCRVRNAVAATQILSDVGQTLGPKARSLRVDDSAYLVTIAKHLMLESESLLYHSICKTFELRKPLHIRHDPDDNSDNETEGSSAFAGHRFAPDLPQKSNYYPRSVNLNAAPPTPGGIDRAAALMGQIKSTLDPILFPLSHFSQLPGPSPPRRAPEETAPAGTETAGASP